MLQVLFWVSHLPAVVATLVVFYVLLARIRRVWVARLLGVLGPMVGVGTIYVPALVVAWLVLAKGIDFQHIVYPLTVVVALVCAGAGCLWWKTLRRQDSGNQMRGRAWRMRPCMIAMACLWGVHIGIIAVSSSAVTTRLLAVRHDARQTIDGLAPRKSIDDAGELYQQAFAVMNVPYISQMQEPVPERNPLLRQPLTLEIREYLARYAAALPLLREAASKPAWTMDIDYTQPSLWMWEDSSAFTNIRAAARLLAWDAIAAAEDGDGQRATQNILALRAMATQVGMHPVGLPNLVELSLWSLAHATLEHVLGIADLAPLALRQLSQSPSCPSANLDRLVQMERALTAEMLVLAMTQPRQMRQDVVASDVPMWVQQLSTLPSRLFLADAELARLHVNMDRMLAAATVTDRPVPDALASLREHRGPRTLFMEILMPMTEVALGAAYKAEAAHRSALVGAAIVAYTAEHNGAYPPSLGALVPTYLQSMPMDPYTNTPLRYRSSAGGAVIYSVGTDGDDDSGLDGLASPSGAFGRGDEGDIGFILRHPDPPAIKTLPKVEEPPDISLEESWQAK